jgi:PAT family beta-lactamase induction signal transducer AmpG
MYGTRSAIMMDVTNPAVAATQFTAYMALMNLAISYSATWQGIAIEAWGYPRTMLVDGLFGLACLLVLPWLKRADAASANYADARAPRRARAMAFGLGLLCMAWLPYSHWSASFGAAKPIMGTLFTLIFIASALFLLASRAVLGASSAWPLRYGAWLAPALLLLYARYHLDTLASWLPAGFNSGAFVTTAQAVTQAIAIAAGAVLLWLGTQSWQAIQSSPTAPD